MKHLGTLLLLCLSFATACQKKPAAEVSNEPPIDFSAVLQQAKSENKFVLLDFTGSDWCPPCIAMHENVFTKPKFQDYLKLGTLFVEIDFPHEKPQSDAQKKNNEALAEKYKVDGFPTFVLLNPGGTEVWREVGAFVSSPEEFIAVLETARKK